MKNKKTLVLGATTKPERYAFKAITMLTEKGHSVLAIGQNTGEDAGITIRTKNNPYGNLVFKPSSSARILQLHHRNQTKTRHFQSWNRKSRVLSTSAKQRHQS